MPPPAPPPEPHESDPTGETRFTRAGALKATGVGAAAIAVPAAWPTASAEAARDCYNPCLGIIGEAARRGIRKCQSGPTDFILSIAVMNTFGCLIHNGDAHVNDRAECAEPNCGRFSQVIKNGGTVGGVRVPPLELPAGTKAECDNCRSAGGYCGTCAAGTVSPEQSFFCGTPGVPPSRYCAGG